MKNLQSGKPLVLSAAKSGMCPKTARKYRDASQLPSETTKARDWLTRKDPFEEVFDSKIVPLLKTNEGLQSQTIMAWLYEEYPGKYEPRQLRTLQRKVKHWKALHGSSKEVFFPQIHHPGELCASDFTRMNRLNISIQSEPLTHMVFHFVLTYSNWEDYTICYSENFESLSRGIQNAFFRLGGVPQLHRTDRMSSAVNKPENPKEFTDNYDQLLKHYNITGQKIQAGKANENGDVEKSHDGFKNAVDQALMLRGHRDFASIGEYDSFLRNITSQRNSVRCDKVSEELSLLRQLPHRRLSDFKTFDVKVDKSSRIRVQKRFYSVHSRLIGEGVKVQLHADLLKVYFGGKEVETIKRAYGSKKYFIQYRHVIDWLLRKPGAFENYLYQSDMFPTSTFRLAWEALRKCKEPLQANKEYLKVLNLAAKENEQLVEVAIHASLSKSIKISFVEIESHLLKNPCETSVVIQDPKIEVLCNAKYDFLLQENYDAIAEATQ